MAKEVNIKPVFCYRRTVLQQADSIVDGLGMYLINHLMNPTPFGHTGAILHNIYSYVRIIYVSLFKAVVVIAAKEIRHL